MRILHILVAFFSMLPMLHDQCNAQVDRSMCGAECVFIACQRLGVGDGNFRVVNDALGKPGKGGYTLEQLENYCKSQGLSTKAVNTRLEDLLNLSTPVVAIVHLKRGHFAILNSWKDNRLIILDVDGPALSEVPVTDWSGKALLVSDRPITLVTRNSSSWLIPGTTVSVIATLAAWIGFRRKRS